MKQLRYGGLLLLTILLAACGEETYLNRVQEEGKLVVVTRNAPTTYYVDRDGKTGFEYDLASAFADDLGVELELVVSNNPAEILSLLEKGKVDLAAAGLTRTEQRENRYRFSNSYQQVTQQVVCRRGGAYPEEPEDLVGLSIEVPAETTYVEELKRLQDEIPGLSWEVNPENDTEHLLEQVWRRKLDCTVGDSNIVAINQRYMPELSVRFDLGEPQQLAWAMPVEAGGLQREVNNWLEEYDEAGLLRQLTNKYYGFIEVFDYVDTRAFQRKVRRVLPKYQEMFQAAGKRYDIDWTLLAAQAYQESHWNRYARSPTGVRGIMMLTLITAREVGINSRLDPQQSIMGGAKYLSNLRGRLPDEITEPDRTWIALGAYNVGMGHIYDARKLAREQGVNPNLWHEFREVLPLLAQKKYYKDLKYGYARGLEPVRYVRRIRNYHDMLLQALKVE
ncbi:membrane-bound lytic murein transglycosylase MltF [Thiohalophilus sp.]|uniref:membrane-bound lytic murein transglycosylase MltF n=1 Tax=Thiohalophilus sp. TaxID=3028392 RepID=UPI0039758306